MRILLTADPELPVPPKLYGGIERVVDGLVHELRAHNHEVGLLAHRESAATATRLFPWPGMRSQNRWDVLRNTFALWRSVRRFKPDVLHSFSRMAYLLPVLRSRLPKIMSYQRQPTGRQVARATKLAGRTLAFTACSAFIANQGRPFGGKWVPIPNFVDTEFYQFQPAVADDAPLVFLSRLERIKGAHTAIQIARRAGRQLVIAGNRVYEGEGAAYWDQAIAPHLGKDGIEYAGPVDDAQKNELLGRAAAMLVPIEWDEPFGIVFAEALACGTPVISCPRGALPEIVQDGVHGFLVRSVEEGMSAVQQSGTVSRAACRRWAETMFSADVIVGQYAELYRQMLMNSSRQ